MSKEAIKLKWDFNYRKQPTSEINHDELTVSPSTWRAEQLQDPISVFVDIHNLLEVLTESGNLQLNGLRGTGKTIFFLNAQYKLGQNALKTYKNRKLSAYVDLYNIEPPRVISSPHVRAEHLYREIIKVILEGMGTSHGTLRYYCLKDFTKNLNWWNKRRTNKAINNLRDYVKGLGDKLATDREYKQILEQEQGVDYRLSSEFSASSLKGVKGKTGIASSISDRLVDAFTGIERGLYSAVPKTVSEKFEKLLNALKADKFIIYLDEFSGLSAPRDIQPILIDRLLRTFDSTRISIKISTVTGATFLSTGEHDGASIDKRLLFVDIDMLTQKDPNKVKTGNFEIFLRNLAAKEPKVKRYLHDEKNLEESFNSFVSNYFESKIDFDEFMKAGEGVPRQLLETFVKAYDYRRRRNPYSKITRQDIWYAVQENYRHIFETQVKNIDQSRYIIGRINKVESRVFNLEMVPKFIDPTDKLTDLGVIRACPANTVFNSEFSAHPFAYYYTSYPVEVARQFTKSKESIKKEIQLQIEDMTYITSSDLIRLYPKAQYVLLSEQVPNKS